MKTRRLIIGGNWKMYKTPSEAIHVAKALKVKLINVLLFARRFLIWCR